MFDALSNRFVSAFRSLSGRGRISEENIRESMREVRTALLEADVNFKVVNDFCEKVDRKRPSGRRSSRASQPGQLMVKIVYDELVKLIGPVDIRIYFVQPGPTIIMMCGLQGSGKDHHLRQAGQICSRARGIIHCWPRRICSGRPPSSSSASSASRSACRFITDDRRLPARPGAKGSAVAVCRAAVARPRQPASDVVILDTAGRLHIDDELMGELQEINTQLKPHQIFLVLDAMSGQDAVNSAKAFNEQLELDGLILTKFDSDTRGGACCRPRWSPASRSNSSASAKNSTRLEEFRPEGMAQRILGMGDIVGLVTEAMKKFDQDETARLQAKMEKGQFTLEDFMAQMGQVKKLGPWTRSWG